MVILILVGTAAMTIALIGFLVIVIANIRACERRMNLTRQPVTSTDKFVRRVLGTRAAIGNKEATRNEQP